jgi:hypothetical protein
MKFPKIAQRFNGGSQSAGSTSAFSSHDFPSAEAPGYFQKQIAKRTIGVRKF